MYKHIRLASRWSVFVVGFLLASANATVDEYRFGEWRGEIDLADLYPISITANHALLDEESSTALQLLCEPPGWSGAPDGNARPVFRGLLMDLSSRSRLEDKKQSCVIQASGVAYGGEERIVRSEGLCEMSSVDVNEVDKWGEIMELLSTVDFRSRSAQSKYPPAKPGALDVSRSKRLLLSRKRLLGTPPRGRFPTLNSTGRLDGLPALDGVCTLG